MALSTEQRQQLLDLKSRGVSKEQAMAQVFRRGATTPETRYGDVGEDLMSAGRGAVSDIRQRATNIREGFSAGQRGEQTATETGAQLAGNILGGAGDLAFRGAQAAVTPFMKESEERAVEGAVTDALAPVSNFIGEQSPRTQRNIIGGLGLLEGATAGVGVTVAKPATRGITARIGKFLGREETPTPTPRQTPEQIFAKTETRLQQIANDPNLSAQEKAAAAESALTIRERLSGVTPSEKKRIQEMPPGTLEKYLDQAHLRNINDQEITPYAMGSQQANDALENLNQQLRETGSQIGQTREKLATVKMPQISVQKVDSAFRNELNRLNLTVRDGQIITQPGKIAKTSSPSDINTLQDLFADLQTYKQSPTLANAIDLRMKFDGKIKFGKSAREVSNDVDPVSRSVRKALADEAAKVVGRSNAEELARYSDFMEAYADLKSYTDRAAGGEYLLRLVLSGRGGEAQKLVDTVREYTGIDLMNDATAMKIATDVVGNADQKNLFRQEVTSAGMDAARLFSGDVTGAGATMLRKLAERGLDQETVYRAIAAGTGVYLVATYTDTENILPAGLAVLSAMPAGTRTQAITEAAQLARQTGKTLKLPDSVADEVLTSLNAEEPLTKAMRASDEVVDADDIARLDALQTKSKSTALTDEELVEAGAIMEKYGDQFPSFEQSATTKTTDLVEEAKKYDSAEEFVRAKAGNQSIYSSNNTQSLGTNIPDSNRIRQSARPYDYDAPDPFFGRYNPEIKGSEVKVYRVVDRDELLPGDNVTIFNPIRLETRQREAMGIPEIKKPRKVIEEWIPKKDLYTVDGGTQLYAPDGVKSLEELWERARQ